MPRALLAATMRSARLNCRLPTLPAPLTVARFDNEWATCRSQRMGHSGGVTPKTLYGHRPNRAINSPNNVTLTHVSLFCDTVSPSQAHQQMEKACLPNFPHVPASPLSEADSPAWPWRRD